MFRERDLEEGDGNEVAEVRMRNRRLKVVVVGVGVGVRMISAAADVKTCKKKIQESENCFWFP